MVHLWSGVSKGEDSALQLLCIVDLIRFWVDYTYKPLIGTCISRLKAMKAGRLPPLLDNTLWMLRIPVNWENTPWFFDQRHLKRLSSPSRSTDNLEIPPHWSSRGRSPSSRQSLRPENRSSSRREHRSPTPADEQFVLPEKDHFNWLLDRDPGAGDLILLRVSETGKILRPVIIYSTSRLIGGRQKPTIDWEDDGFNAVIADERRGHRPQINSIFREDQSGRDYLWQFYRSKGSLIRREVQFSIILPVSIVSYRQQNPNPQGSQLFEPLESLFRLQDLLGKIEQANKKWCSCGRPNNGFSPPMVQCCNALCDIGWFHKECASPSDNDDDDSDDDGSDGDDSDEDDSDKDDTDEDDSDDETPWLCDKCEETPEHKRAPIELKPDETNFFARESHKRQHLARAIENVWHKHDWPSQDEMIARLDEVADKVDIVESARCKIRPTGVKRDSELPRYWATSKDDPKNLILTCSRAESLVYHEAVSHEEDKMDATSNEHDFEEETEDYTDEEDGDGSS